MRLLPWILQILILAAGIHLFLRFVRTTRGSRLIRGLLLAVTVVFVGLWSLSKTLDLEELSHLLHGSTGFILVAFVIVFQPELRRAIAQLGERSFVGRLMNPAAGDTLRRVVRAARSMALRRTGALIAFERETSLSPFLEAGTEIDATVTARTLETIFHPGSPLHDGGVIIRRDRVSEAGCIFPLPQQGSVDPRLGTRHRAAMGLTEDSDAVVLVVSEETGAISLAHRGQLRTVISPEEVEVELRRMVEDGEKGDITDGEKKRGGAWYRDLIWLPASILLAAGILYVAHQDIRITKQFHVALRGTAPDGAAEPRDGEILVVVPDAGYQLVTPDERHEVAVSGTRAQLEEIGKNLSGTFVIGDSVRDELALLLSEVSWQKPILGLNYEWVGGQAPLLRVGRYKKHLISLTVEDIACNTAELNPHYQIFPERITFEPKASVVLRGPAAAADRPIAELLEPVVLGKETLSDIRERVRLTPEAIARGFSLEGSVHVTIPVGPARREAGTITKEVALIALDPTDSAEISRWSLPGHAQTARFRIETEGLIPAGADPGSAVFRERIQTIRRYVDENLLVFVDLSELPPEGEGQSLEVRYYLRDQWTQSLDSLIGLGENEVSGGENLVVHLESEKRIRLERREAPAPLTEDP